MKTFLDFVNSIGYEEFKANIEQHFDQLMALYRLCGTCNISTNSVNTNNTEIEFEILFANTTDIDSMENLINVSHNSIRIYDTDFSVDSDKIADNVLKITIRPYA